MNAPVLRVTVVEDDVRYRESLVTLLTHAPSVSLQGAYGSALIALEAISTASSRPQLVLMDLDLPGMHGAEATRRLKANWPDLLVVVLTVFEDPAAILEAICSGADGYLLKRTPPAELLEQIDVVARGGAPLTAAVARTVMEIVRRAEVSPRWPTNAAAPDPGVHLSERERDVLRGLVDGLAYKQVADRLGVSIDTVRTHVRGLYRKLQVHSVAEAVGRALRERLI